jgi:hypothetical protein
MFDQCEGADQLVDLAPSLVPKATTSTLVAVALWIGHNHRRDMAHVLTQAAQLLIERSTQVSASALLQVLHQCNNIGVIVPELAAALVKRTVHTSDFDQSRADPGTGGSSSSDEAQQEPQQQHSRSNAFHRQLLVLLGPYSPELTGQYLEWACSVLQRTAHQLQPWELSKWCAALSGYSQLLEQRLSVEQRAKLAEAVTDAVQHAATALTQQQQQQQQQADGRLPSLPDLSQHRASMDVALRLVNWIAPNEAGAIAAAMASSLGSSATSNRVSADGGMHAAQPQQLELALQLASNAKNLLVALGQQ